MKYATENAGDRRQETEDRRQETVGWRSFAAHAEK